MNGGRLARRFIILLLVLGGILVAADFGFAAVAEHRISQRARQELRLTDDPAVTIHGFPFTTQAISDDYDHITISAAGIAVGDVLRQLELVAHLHDVQAPLNEVLEGDTSAIAVGTLKASVRIAQADLGRVIKLPQLRIEPATEAYVRSGDEDDNEGIEQREAQEDEQEAGPGGRTYSSSEGVKFSATTDSAGTEVEIVMFAMVELETSVARIKPERLVFGNDQQTMVVPESVREALLAQFETTVDPGALPFDVQPTGIDVDYGALFLQGKVEDVTFDEGAEAK